jgi:hypothetical protein
MSQNVLKFEIARATEFATESGRRYIRLRLQGLLLTLVPDPEPDTNTGLLGYSVMASPAAGFARRVTSPAPAAQGAPAEPRVVMREKLSKAACQDAAAAEVIERNGAIPPGGDTLSDLFPAPAGAAPDSDEPDIRAAIALLETPVC